MTEALFPDWKLIFQVVFLSNILSAQDIDADIYSGKISTFKINHYYESEFQFSGDFQEYDNTIRPYFSGKWWISPNLNVSGAFSPSENENDIQLYFQTSIGYIPQLILFPWTDTSFNAGIHRIKYFEEKNYRWYHAAFCFTKKLDNQFLSATWIYLFDEWHTHILQMEYYQNILDNFQFNVGFKISTTNSNSNFQPILGLLIHL